MGLLDLLFPKTCVGCGKLGTYFCPHCIKNIKQDSLVCPACERSAIGGKTHPLCKKRYGLDGLWSLGVYEDSLRKIIQKFKYKFVSEIAENLCDLMIEYWAKYTPQFIEEIKKDRGQGWVIVSVPLHSKRENFRGFNQSALLGKILSKKLGLDYSDALKRIRNTKQQVGLIGKDRKNNIHNAFSLDSRFLTLDSNILLIDDVWTTGSTLKECCYVLKRGGASKVWAITLAR